MIDKDYLFWNDNETVGYFMNKPADPLIENHLKTVSLNDIKMMNALDLGCGCGRHTELLVNNGFATYAIDVNPSMLEATKNRIRKACKNPTMGLMKGSILSIPFENNFFDIIITTGVLHQARSLDEYKKAILEMARVCKKNAIVLLNIEPISYLLP